ncbi:MAG: class I SAM-dependent methyltransferase [Candidatus Eisenbacteria bacterium]
MMDGPLFYGARGLNVETYDALQEVHESKGEVIALRGDVAFYREHALRLGGPVLELACGTGRVAWPLAEAGLDVVGLDLSEAMLEVAREKAARYPSETRQRIRFLRGNMADFDLGRSFALAVIAFRSFQSLLTPEEERSCLECVRRHLLPGGRLLVNNFDPRLDYCLPGAPSPAIRRDGVRHALTGNEVRIEVVSRAVDPLCQRIEEKWRFAEIGAAGVEVRAEEETLRLRWIYRWEMRHLLELCGFEVEAEFSDFEGSPPAYGKEQIWVARPCA